MEITNTQNDDFVSRPPGEQECDKVMEILDRMIDGYASYEEEIFFGNHAEDCSPCFQDLERQRVFIQFLNTTIKHKGVPDTLIHSIKSGIDKTV
jgi:hypothetical protein